MSGARLGEHIADHAFMGAVGIGVDQADRDALVACARLSSPALRLGALQRHQHLALRH